MKKNLQGFFTCQNNRDHLRKTLTDPTALEVSERSQRSVATEIIVAIPGNSNS